MDIITDIAARREEKSRLLNQYNDIDLLRYNVVSAEMEEPHWTLWVGVEKESKDAYIIYADTSPEGVDTLTERDEWRYSQQEGKNFDEVKKNDHSIHTISRYGPGAADYKEEWQLYYGSDIIMSSNSFAELMGYAIVTVVSETCLLNDFGISAPGGLLPDRSVDKYANFPDGVEWPLDKEKYE